MAQDAILFRPREKDTSTGVTRKTLKRLAEVLDMKETEVIHKALAKYARDNLPAYEADDDALTQAQHRAIRQHVEHTHGKGELVRSLFAQSEAKPRAPRKTVRSSSRTR